MFYNDVNRNAHHTDHRLHWLLETIRCLFVTADQHRLEGDSDENNLRYIFEPYEFGDNERNYEEPDVDVVPVKW